MPRGFEDQVNRLVSYIEEEQNRTENGWVIITHRDVPKITGYSQYYTNRAFEALKNHSYVAYRIADTKRPNRPFEFRVCSSYEEKVELTVNGSQFRYLEDDEVQEFKNKLSEENFEDLMLHLRILDFLCLSGIKQKPVEFNIEKIATTFVVPVNKVEHIYLNLLDKGILEDKGDVYTLSTTTDKIQSFTNNESHSKILGGNEDEKWEGTKEPEEKTEEPSMSELVESVRNMADLQKQFKDFFDDRLQQLIDSNKGYEALQKAAEEDQKLRDRISEFEQENRLLQQSLEKKDQDKEEFISEVQSRLEVLAAELTNLTSSYVSIPAWKKDQRENARFQRQITNAITSAIDDILEKAR